MIRIVRQPPGNPAARAGPKNPMQQLHHFARDAETFRYHANFALLAIEANRLTLNINAAPAAAIAERRWGR
jgi:hypothetical protein